MAYEKEQYPLVLFMADGSTTGKGALAPLKQGYGGIIWATDESQEKHSSFVLLSECELSGLLKKKGYVMKS